MNISFALIKNSLESSTNWTVLIIIQVVLLALFIGMITYICKLVRRKEPNKSIKKTCILISFISAIAWFIIGQIVWIITTIQLSGN